MGKKQESPTQKVNQPAYRVSICHDRKKDKFFLLEEALEKADFWDVIQEAWKSSKLAQKKFLILIKPDLNMFDLNSTTGTDPELVEHLIDLLAQKGFSNIMVADSPGDADLWLENRDVLILADLLGYKFETPGQQPYDIINLSENLIDDVFPKGDPLAGEEISEHWVKAHFTINFAKNKSDEANLFSLCLNNLIHVLPLRAKTYHYQHRLDAGEVAISVLTHISADFNIIDAFISNHGSQGNRHSRPLETRTIIAGNHGLLCDWVGALKMGLDPYASNIHGAALRTLGLPENYQIKGELNVYQGWEKISPFLRDSVLKRNSIPAIQKLSQPWLQEVNTEYFPFKQVYDEQINGIITPLIKDIDDHPVAHWMMIAINYLLVSISKAQKAWQVMYNKDQLYRKEVGLGVDLEKFADEDFEAVENYVRPFIQILQHTEPDRNGIKWRYIDESVLFEFSKILPVPYEDFIEKVEISQAVQMMYDNIGGLVVPVKKNQNGRVIHQAERDIYLPQPNWMILFDGKFIDVGKIECLKYKPDQREIWWRTVQSQNDSADFDDGMVRFAEDPGGTKITIIARQKFALPTFWKVVNMDFFPEVKDALVSDAYLRFFSRTMANYEAVWEGRKSTIGKTFDENYGENGIAGLPLEVEQLKTLLSMFSGVAKKWFQRNNKNSAIEEVGLDEHGYRHFGPPSSENDSVRSFFNDLTNAIQKDFRLLSGPSNQDS